MSDYHMTQARKEQERPLRLAKGSALLALMAAKTGDDRRSARAQLLRAEEALRLHGFQP